MSQALVGHGLSHWLTPRQPLPCLASEYTAHTNGIVQDCRSQPGAGRQCTQGVRLGNTTGAGSSFHPPPHTMKNTFLGRIGCLFSAWGCIVSPAPLSHRLHTLPPLTVFKTIHEGRPSQPFSPAVPPNAQPLPLLICLNESLVIGVRIINCTVRHWG